MRRSSRNRATVLYGADAAGREAAAVADALDVVNDFALGIAGQQEVAVQRMDGAAGLDG